MWGGWMDPEVLHDSIKRGGFPEVAQKDVTNALKGLTKDPRVHSNKIGKRAFYALVQPGDEPLQWIYTTNHKKTSYLARVNGSHFGQFIPLLTACC
jgi:hypothetical protein